eukprot:gene18387-12061_t
MRTAPSAREAEGGGAAGTAATATRGVAARCGVAPWRDMLLLVAVVAFALLV